MRVVSGALPSLDGLSVGDEDPRVDLVAVYVDRLSLLPTAIELLSLEVLLLSWCLRKDISWCPLVFLDSTCLL